MFTLIFWLILLLIVLGLVLYVVDLLPIPGSPNIKSAIKALVVLLFIVVIARAFGLFGGAPYMRF